MIDVDLSSPSTAAHASGGQFPTTTQDDGGLDGNAVASPATVQRRRAIEDALDCVDQRRAQVSAGSATQGKGKLSVSGQGRARGAVIIDDDDDQEPPA